MIRQRLATLNQTCCSLLNSFKSKEKPKMIRFDNINDKTSKINSKERPQKRLSKKYLSLKDFKKNKQAIKQRKNPQQLTEIRGSVPASFNLQRVSTSPPQNQERLISPSRNSYKWIQNNPQILRHFEVRSSEKFRNHSPTNVIFSYGLVVDKSTQNYIKRPFESKGQLKNFIEPLFIKPLPLHMLKQTKDNQQSSSQRTVISMVIQPQPQYSVIIERVHSRNYQIKTNL